MLRGFTDPPPRSASRRRTWVVRPRQVTLERHRSERRGYWCAVEPIPETRRALDELARTNGEDLLPALVDTAERVAKIVPSFTGLSLALRRNGLTFTLVATSDEVARLDAVQYLEGGPCVEGGEVGEVVAFQNADPLDEARWSAFARATASAGVASTLTLPIRDTSGTAFGSVNLYAAERHAFDGHHEELAELLDAWAPGAVADADLSFRTRDTAEAAPALLEERTTIDRAIGVLMSSRGLSVSEARSALQDVAERSGTSEVAVAELVLETRGGRQRSKGGEEDDDV